MVKNGKMEMSRIRDTSIGLFVQNDLKMLTSAALDRFRPSRGLKLQFRAIFGKQRSEMEIHTRLIQ